MYSFASPLSYFDFARRVRSSERYSRGPETSAFLSAITATSQKRLKLLANGTVLWRAQLGCELAPADHMAEGYEQQLPHPPKRMFPLHSAPSEGRANPAGIPVLYLATDEHTAIAEVRAWVGKNVSVAQFKVERDLRVLDCSGDLTGEIHLYERPATPEEREAAVWQDINKAFSEPTSVEDDRTAYVPTQILAEHFKSLGADGIVYKSSLGDGKNMALFDVDAADIMNCALHLVRGIRLTYEEIVSPYYIPKHYPDIKAGESEA